MTALLLLRAPARQHCCPRPCRTAAPSPGQAWPFEGHSAQLLLPPPPPPPLNQQTKFPPTQHPRMPLVVAATAVPHPPVPLA